MMKRSTITVRLASFLLLCLIVTEVDAGAEEPADQRRMAAQLYSMGYVMTLLGRYEDAIRLYKKSLDIEPSAEAHTFLGWTYSHLGDYGRAIQEAEQAILIDPDFGNPYNDIGVYLMELGREDEAIPYLEKAMSARRYCCYQFPHFNLGRIYLKKGMYEKARREFQKSLTIAPDYAPARRGLELLEEARGRQI